MKIPRLTDSEVFRQAALEGGQCITAGNPRLLRLIEGKARPRDLNGKREAAAPVEDDAVAVHHAG